MISPSLLGIALSMLAQVSSERNRARAPDYIAYYSPSFSHTLVDDVADFNRGRPYRLTSWPSGKGLSFSSHFLSHQLLVHGTDPFILSGQEPANRLRLGLYRDTTYILLGI
jgi:hypothetical protein